jgi:asparagine synthase (glutamine-hydrolysing)
VSGVAGVFGPAAGADARLALSPVLGAVRRRGSARSDVWSDASAALGVTRFDWELADGSSGGAPVVSDGTLAVAADASIYYREDLRRALHEAGVPVAGETVSHLILAAYRAWGERCAERLEGDYAFVVWDAGARRAFGARDLGGKRPLYYAAVGSGLVAASTIGGVLAFPGCPHDLDLVAVANDAAGLFADAAATCHRAVRALPAGCCLTWQAGQLDVRRHWSPPPARDASGPGFEEAAHELRALLGRAVEERLAPGGPTSVWLSGGWDSTAVFASGERILRGHGAGAHLQAVSVSFPPGDPGREDELILDVAAHWGSPVRWLDIQDVPLLATPAERAAARDEPFAHAFEMMNRALAAGSRASGARVAFDGVGGDQLFQVSEVYFADLLRAGRLRTLAREWRGKGLSGRGARTFFRWAVQPLLPHALLDAAAFLRGGRPLRGYLERTVPPWIDRRFAAEHGLAASERRAAPARRGRSPSAYETHWFLSYPYFPRAFAAVAGLALEEGVELRSPLYDRRVIEFALTRPRDERSQGAETKRLLRAAMAGLLPAHVLAPRRRRTGVTGGYLARSLRREQAAVLDGVFRSSMILEELGIINAPELRRNWCIYLQQGGGGLGVALFLTFQVELWLRARLGGGRGASMTSIPSPSTWTAPLAPNR